MDPMTGLCSVWLAIKGILRSQTPDLCKNIIFKNQLLFTLIHLWTDSQSTVFCQVPILSAAWYRQQFFGFSTKLKTKVCSQKASGLCRHWDYGEKDGSLKLKRSWFSNMIFLQKSGVCDPIMHFIENQTLHNPGLGPNNQLSGVETIPDSVMWPQSSVLLWRILTALYCIL